MSLDRKIKFQRKRKPINPQEPCNSRGPQVMRPFVIAFRTWWLRAQKRLPHAHRMAQYRVGFFAGYRAASSALSLDPAPAIIVESVPAERPLISGLSDDANDFAQMLLEFVQDRSLMQRFADYSGGRVRDQEDGWFEAELEKFRKEIY